MALRVAFDIFAYVAGGLLYLLLRLLESGGLGVTKTITMMMVVQVVRSGVL
jgi:hypothetical protein